MSSLIALIRRAILPLLVTLPLALALPASAQATGTATLRAPSSFGERAPVKIGVSGPFSGPSAPMGLSMREGIRIAAAEINASGGLLGHRVELVERDDEASNELGAQIVREFVNRERVVAGLGIVNTGVALASQRHYQTARIPVITSVATGTLITRQFQPPEFAENYVFRVSANDTLQAEVIVDEAVTRRGLNRLAILHDATNYGVLGSADLAAALRQQGIEPVAIIPFDAQLFGTADKQVGGQVSQGKQHRLGALVAQHTRQRRVGGTHALLQAGLENPVDGVLEQPFVTVALGFQFVQARRQFRVMALARRVVAQPQKPGQCPLLLVRGPRHRRPRHHAGSTHGGW